MQEELDQIKDNLIKTKLFVIDNPTNHLPFNAPDLVKMIDYALENWDAPEKRLSALEVLADKESHFNRTGITNDDDRDNDDGYFIGILELLENTDELDGLGRHRTREERKKNRHDKKDKRHDRRDKRHDKHPHRGDAVNKINKFNPATVAVRNSARALIAMNIFGIATMLNTKKAKDTGVCDKVEKLYYSFGGKKQKLYDAIKKGASKKPLLNHKLKKQIEQGKISGLGELGNIGAMVISAMGFLAPILKWVKDAGLDKLVGSGSSHNSGKTPHGSPSSKPPSSTSNTTTSNQNTGGGANPYLPNTTKTSVSNNYNVNTKPPQTNDDNKKKKIIIFSAIGVLGVGTGIYLYSQMKNKQKLSGIELAE